jgi:hypothetical protein
MMEETKVQADPHRNSNTLHRDELNSSYESAHGVGEAMKRG